MFVVLVLFRVFSYTFILQCRLPEAAYQVQPCLALQRNACVSSHRCQAYLRHRTRRIYEAQEKLRGKSRFKTVDELEDQVRPRLAYDFDICSR